MRRPSWCGAGAGALFDVAVDIRRGSPTYGQWAGAELSAENGKQLLVPAGFLHGFVTREPDTEILYKCSDYYAPECDGAVRWDSCGIDWGLRRRPGAVGQGRERRPAAVRLRQPLHLGGRMKLLVTGGAGFIGSAVVRQAIARGHAVVNLDALTYAACLDNVARSPMSPLYSFVHADIRDRAALGAVLAAHARTR